VNENLKRAIVIGAGIAAIIIGLLFPPDELLIIPLVLGGFAALGVGAGS
jgi:hypothetical protein